MQQNLLTTLRMKEGALKRFFFKENTQKSCFLIFLALVRQNPKGVKKKIFYLELQQRL